MKKKPSLKTKFSTTLIKNYVLFTGSTILILFIVLAFAIFRLFGLIGMVSSADFKSQTEILESGNYHELDLEPLEERNGWIEILDKDYKVVYTKGKVLEKRDFYEKLELDALTTPDLLPYSYEKFEFKSESGEDFTLLTKIPTEKSDYYLNETTAYFENTFSQMFTLFIGLYIINIVFFIRWLNKKVKAPLDKINSGMNKFIESNEEIQLESDGDLEFAQISTTFNEMVQRLKTMEKEKAALEESKQKMLADISHDIKTPITTINGYSKAIAEGYVEDPESLKKYLNIIHKQSSKVTELINLLFEYVKVEHPNFKMDLKKDDLGEFIREIIAENYEHIEDQGFNLEFSIPDKTLLFDFDKPQFKRAISNLINNSLKYNDAGTTISIILSETEKEYTILISDDGIGIPEFIQKDIFQPFVTSNKSRSSVGGTGLGLAITKQIIEKHNGKISLISLKKNYPSTQFRITLKKAKSQIS